MAARDPAWVASAHLEWDRVFLLDPQTGYRLIPNRRTRMRPSVDHRPYWLVTDAQGFRNPRDVLQADLVAVGDSMTERWGVPERGTWVRQLERMTGLSVANLGVRAHRLPEKLATLEVYGLPKRPRIALLQYGDDLGASDEGPDQPVATMASGALEENVRRLEAEQAFVRSPEGLRAAIWDPTSAEIQARRAGGPWWVRLGRAVASESVVYRLFEMLKGTASAQDRATIISQSIACSINRRLVRLPADSLRRLQRLDAPERHPDWPLLQAALRRLQARCAAQETQLVLVVIPDPLPVYLPLVADQLPGDPALIRTAVQQVDRHARLLGSWCAAQGLLFIDTTHALRAAAARGSLLAFPVDPHWDAPGCRVIAQAIVHGLQEAGLLSSDGQSPTR